MKISYKISIVFSVIASVFIILFGILVYQLEKNHTQTDFANQLKKRIQTTEKFFLEKDKLSPKQYTDLKQQFTQKLPYEYEEVIELDNSKTFDFKHKYSPELKESLIQNSNFSFFQKYRQGESKIFELDGKKYLIVVSAIDLIGNQNLNYLLRLILILILIAIPLIFIFGFTYSKKALEPIRNKIHEANKISASNLNKRLEIENPNDELGQLSIAFNSLLERIEKSFNIQKSFISNASHEIKNPLTAIMGEAEIALSKERDPAAYVESLESILSESERLNLTVNNLLQLSKVTSKDGEMSMDYNVLEDFMIECIQSYTFLNPNHQIIFNASDLEGQISLKFNKNLLKTALINILDNANKFSNNQPVEVKIKKINQTVCIIVKDKGIGIPESEIEAIKQTFYRGSNTISIEGSGIGFALAHKIIELHQGKINVNSKVGEGTVIEIILPLV
jgi:signal transduction histidine kinase